MFEAKGLAQSLLHLVLASAAHRIIFDEPRRARPTRRQAIVLASNMCKRFLHDKWCLEDDNKRGLPGHPCPCLHLPFGDDPSTVEASFWEVVEGVVAWWQ